MATKKQIKDLIPDNLFTRTTWCLLQLFFSYPSDSFYLAEIFREIGGGRSPVQNSLASLTEDGILKMVRRGRFTDYIVNRDCPVYPELLSFVNKSIALEIKKTLRIKGVKLAFIYGSVAKGTARRGSDIDLFVVGDVKFGDVVNKLHDIEQVWKREINPSVFHTDEFKRRLKESEHFVTSVMSGEKVYVTGGEDELKELAGCGVS